MTRRDSKTNRSVGRQIALRAKRQRATQTVHKRDERGRPTDVTFQGDPALQCPACLSTEVEAFGAIHFVFVGDGDDQAPVRRMRCRTCRGKWWRPGI